MFKGLPAASGRLRVLPLPIALPRTCRSRWPVDQLTFAYTRSRPLAISAIGDPITASDCSQSASTDERQLLLKPVVESCRRRTSAALCNRPFVVVRVGGVGGLHVGHRPAAAFSSRERGLTTHKPSVNPAESRLSVQFAWSYQRSQPPRELRRLGPTTGHRGAARVSSAIRRAASWIRRGPMCRTPP